MAKFDFDKPVASFSWYLQNGSADDKRGNRLHVGTGQKAQIYFDPESGEFIGKLKYVDDYIDLADGAKQHFELPRTAREYKPSDFSPKFPISNVKFEVDESVKDFIHVLPRGLFFYQNEFYDAVFGDKTDYPESLKDFLFTRTGNIEGAGEFYGAIEKWPQSVYGTLVEKCNVENRPIPEYENDRVLPLDYHKELLASLKDHFGCGESNYRTPGDLIAARSYGSYLSGISLKFNPHDVIAAVEHATETIQAELVPYLSDSFGPDRYLPCGCHIAVPMNNSIENAAQQRIIDDGLIRIDDVNNYLAKLIVETNGLRREGNFYIEENPEDGLGAITHIALCLSKQNWFRNYAKVLKCYRWNADTQDFDIEDAIQDMIFADFPVS